MSNISSSQQHEEGSENLSCSHHSGPYRMTYETLCGVLAVTTVPTVRIAHTAPATAPHSACNDSSLREDETVLTHLQFYREFVSRSRPCIIRGLMDDWPAVKKWRDDAYLFQLEPQHFNTNASASTESTPQAAAAPARVTVSLTPNGRADCITDVVFHSKSSGAGGSEQQRDLTDLCAESERVFMAPVDVKVPFPLVLGLIKQARELHSALMEPLTVDLCGSAARRKYRPRPVDPGELIPIPYCQTQTNCLESEFPWLKSDISPSVSSFGEDVFGAPCDAANIWIGTSMSVSSMHQDWYENLYGVVRGSKKFTLIPPWEAPLIKKETVRSAKYCLKQQGDASDDPRLFTFAEHVEFEEGQIDWIGIDLEDSQEHEIMTRNPDILNANPLCVDVGAGEVLYLPAMWFHRVAQAEVPADDTCVVAINYWFDMCMEGPMYHLVKYVAGNGSGTECM